MKISFLTPEYPHSTTGSSGGIGTSIKNLADALVSLGHQVIILVYNQSCDNSFYDDGIKIIQIKNIKFKGLSWFFTRKKIEKRINLLHLKNEIEVVESPDWTGITSYIKPKKCPVIIKLHGSDTYFCHLDNRPVKWWNKFHEKRALGNANGYISVSNYTAQITNKIFKSNYKFEIIHNGINSDYFDGEDDRIKSKNRLILYFGTLIRKKGALEIPFIFNKVIDTIPDAELLLVGKDSNDVITGNSSTWEMMKPLFSSKSSKNVNYLGIVPHSEMKSILKKASVCIFPTFAEAFPVSWLEAMAMEKPIVASNIGWGKEVLQDQKEGFLVHPTNHKVFAERISKIIENPELQKSLGTNAKKRIVTDFEIKKIAMQNLDYYQKIINLNASN